MADTAWLALIASLPTSRSGARMRLWRATKAIGAVALRDGAYLLPDTPACQETFAGLAADVRASAGEAWLVKVAPLQPHEQQAWRARFDRSADFAALLDEARAARLADLTPSQAARKLQALRRRQAQLMQADHFPGSAQAECAALLAQLQHEVDRRTQAEAPPVAAGPPPVERLDPATHRGRIWAGPARPGLDALACGWLIRTGIDPDARFRWVASPVEVRAGWIGFAQEGLRLGSGHGRTALQTMLIAFGLDDDAALRRIAEVVHCVTLGGPPVREASGIAAAVSGLRHHLHEDDALLDAACAVLDGLKRAYDVPA